MTCREDSPDLAIIKPFEYDDSFTGHRIAVTTSPQYSVLSVDDRQYYFTRESGEFDGTSFRVADGDGG
ncbi:MAG: hypothetical protein SVP26_04745 [Chloroflexota bacterium]|nr:hypothetical protein [Chloroflexota bacterium]